MKAPHQIDATEHYRQQAQEQAEQKVFVVGILLGCVASYLALAVWEVFVR